MTAPLNLEQLAQDIRYVRDRLDIQDCVMRHCRGVDRHDAELMSSCYHPDAIVKHGNSDTRISGAEYGSWSNGAHEGRFALHSHNITNMIVEIDGDVAHVESYVLTGFLTPEMDRTTFATGRYIDQFERRDGVWKITLRRAFLDIALDADATYFGAPRGQPIDPQQFWSREDPSYQNPIDLSTPSPQWT